MSGEHQNKLVFPLPQYTQNAVNKALSKVYHENNLISSVNNWHE